MLDDLHVLDLATLTWRPAPPASPPLPRLCRHGLAVSGAVAMPGPPDAALQQKAGAAGRTDAAAAGAAVSASAESLPSGGKETATGACSLRDAAGGRWLEGLCV